MKNGKPKMIIVIISFFVEQEYEYDTSIIFKLFKIPIALNSLLQKNKSHYIR